MLEKQLLENDKEYTQVATLGTGFSFGELALINNKPRAASIRCLAPSWFAVLDKESYQTVLGAIYKKQLNAKVDFLKSIPVFSDWTRAALEKLTYYFKEKEFKRGHYVFREAEPAKWTYIVLEGEFELTKDQISEDKDKKEGNVLKDFISVDNGKSGNRLEAGNIVKQNTVQDTNNSESIQTGISKTMKSKNTLFISLYGSGHMLGNLLKQ